MPLDSGVSTFSFPAASGLVLAAELEYRLAIMGTSDESRTEITAKLLHGHYNTESR